MLWSVGELPLTGGTDLTWFDRASPLAHISSIWTLHYLLGKIHRTRGLEYQRADTFLYTSRGPCRSTETISSAYISATSVLMCSPNNSSYADIRTKGNRISFVRPYYKRETWQLWHHQLVCEFPCWCLWCVLGFQPHVEKKKLLCSIRGALLYLLFWNQTICHAIVCKLLIGQDFYAFRVISLPDIVFTFPCGRRYFLKQKQKIHVLKNSHVRVDVA